MGRFFLPLFLLAYCCLFFLTLQDFGLTWDSALGEFALGDKSFEFWRTLDPNALSITADDLSQNEDFRSAQWSLIHPAHVPSFGPLLASISHFVFFEKLSWLDAVSARHAFLLLLVGCLFVKLFSHVRRYISEDVAVLSLLALAVYPRFWAHAHNNIKDVPSAVFFALAAMSFFEAVVERTNRRYLEFGVYFGFALASKPNAVFLPVVLVLWLFVSRNKVRVSALCSSLLCAAVAFSFASPLFILEPSRLWEQWEYLREFSAAGPPVWQLMPTIHLLTTMPGAFLPFFVWGLIRLPRYAQRESGAAVFLFFWLIIPILRVSIPYANDFDVLRHWMEVLPVVAILFSVGFFDIVRRIRWGRELAVIGIFVPTLLWNIFNHPFNLCFYNFTVGGLSGAQTRNFPQSTDYWGSSYRLAAAWLNEHASKGAVVYVGVGEHILASVSKFWLREDLELRPFSTFQTGGDRTSYLLYITRQERYPEGLLEFSQPENLVEEWTVDGGAILRIYKFSADETTQEGSDEESRPVREENA